MARTKKEAPVQEAPAKETAAPAAQANGVFINGVQETKKSREAWEEAEKNGTEAPKTHAFKIALDKGETAYVNVKPGQVVTQASKFKDDAGNNKTTTSIVFPNEDVKFNQVRVQLADKGDDGKFKYENREMTVGELKSRHETWSKELHAQYESKAAALETEKQAGDIQPEA